MSPRGWSVRLGREEPCPASRRLPPHGPRPLGSAPCPPWVTPYAATHTCLLCCAGPFRLSHGPAGAILPALSWHLPRPVFPHVRLLVSTGRRRPTGRVGSVSAGMELGLEAPPARAGWAPEHLWAPSLGSGRMWQRGGVHQEDLLSDPGHVASGTLLSSPGPQLFHL